MERNHRTSRRTFLGGAAGIGVLAAGATLAGGRFRAEADEHQSVIVIGSGYAGAVVAYRLAQHGIDTTVLERGRRWRITPQGDTFATPDHPDGRAAWLSTTSPFTTATLNRYPGVLEAYPADGITVLAGAGVGGGSLVNNSVLMQPSEELYLASVAGTDAVDYAELAATWYPRARALLRPQPMPDDVLASRFYTAARMFADEATRAGLPPLFVDMGIDWSVVRQEMTGARVPSVVAGQSIWGVNSGARLSVDRTVLAAAEAVGCVRVVTQANVTDIERRGHGYVVTTQRIDEHGQVAGTTRYTADTVVFAAGSLNTNRLLVRARDTGRLPSLSAGIGQGWGNNGDNISMRGGLPFNNPTQGGPSGVVIRDWADRNAAATLLNFPWATEPADGTGALGTLGVAVVPAVGTFAYRAGQVELTWPGTNPKVRATTTAVNATLDRINAVTQGSFTGFTDPGTTAHPLGGVRMGRDCDGFGALHGYPGLWVVDGSLLPGSCGAVPPALTITAIADRCSTAILTSLRERAA
ncbi:FAD-dependent oxidoreductase [Actinokineospora enzanensis]|uniref:FAD-dependent oxidoreductase n=1 Tax=Actinokineospora enzanensis TaxID=155975 RepID=UPI0003620043|nr:FAD-dependent oxidoreductase [Actinokineospora enzanensis]